MLLNQGGLVVGWDCATAHVPENSLQWLIAQFIRICHTPSDFVVNQEAFDAESGLYRESLVLDNVWTTFCHLICDPIMSIISMA
jgi:hypothetical protein